MLRFVHTFLFLLPIFFVGCLWEKDRTKIQKAIGSSSSDKERIKSTVSLIDSILEENIVKIQKINNDPRWWNYKDEAINKIDASMKELGFERYDVRNKKIYFAKNIPLYAWIKISETGESIVVGECKNEGNDIHLKGTLFRQTIASGERQGEQTSVEIPLRQLTRRYDDKAPLSPMVARHSEDVDRIQAKHPIECNKNSGISGDNKNISSRSKRGEKKNSQLDNETIRNAVLAGKLSSLTNMKLDGCGCPTGGAPEPRQAEVLQVGRKQEGGPSDSGYWPVRVELYGTCPADLDADWECEQNEFKGVFEYGVYNNPYGEWKSKPRKLVRQMRTERDKVGEKSGPGDYRRVEHGDHYHYFPEDRNKDTPLSKFPTQPPEPGEKITPSGEVVESRPDS